MFWKNTRNGKRPYFSVNHFSCHSSNPEVVQDLLNLRFTVNLTYNSATMVQIMMWYCLNLRFLVTMTDNFNNYGLNPEIVQDLLNLI